MIVRESMRRFPPAPTFARQSIEDTTVGEWDMPKGSLITVSPGRKVSSAIASRVSPSMRMSAIFVPSDVSITLRNEYFWRASLPPAES